MPTEPRYPVAQSTTPTAQSLHPGSVLTQRNQSPLDLVISQLEHEIDQLHAELNFFYVKLEPFMSAQPLSNEKPEPSNRPGVSPIVVHLSILSEKVGVITAAVMAIKSRLEL